MSELENKARGEVTVQDRWQITIPKSIRKALNIAIGQGFVVSVAGQGFLFWPLELCVKPEKSSENEGKASEGNDL